MKKINLLFVLIAISHFTFGQFTGGTGIDYNYGKVGIGTNNPQGMLHVNGDAANHGIYLEREYTGSGYSGTDSRIFISGSGGSLGLRFMITPNNGVLWSEPLFLKNNGNVGLGTFNPIQKLDVNGNINLNGNITNSASNGVFYIQANSSTAPYIEMIGSGHTDNGQIAFVHRNGKDALFIHESGGTWTNTLTIKSNGNVCLGQPVNNDAKLIIRTSYANNWETSIKSEFTNENTYLIKSVNTNTSDVPFTLTTSGYLVTRGGIAVKNSNNEDVIKIYNNGRIWAKEIKVAQTNPWPDFVFDNEYVLPALSETESYIRENRHLPGVPSAAEIMNDGIDLGNMNTILLQKIEELTLYIISLEKQVKELQTRVNENQNQ